MRAKWLLGLVFLVGGGVFYHTATNVSRGDIVAYNDLTRPIHLDEIKPGDILAFSPEGGPVDVICALDSATDPDNSNPEKRIYFNSLGNIMPPFERLLPTVADQVGTVVSLTDAASQPKTIYGISFSGQISRLPKQNRAEIPDKCNCDMAERIRLRQRVCVVNKVLTEAGGNWQAVGLAMYSNIVPREQFEGCGVSMSTVPLDYFSSPPKCHDPDRHDWDVKTRSWLKLIEVEVVSRN